MQTIMTLNQLLAQVGNPQWDLICIGDGSGQGWAKPAGWAVVLIDRQNGTRTPFVGGVSKGTVNWAEASCYLHAIAYDYQEVHHYNLKSTRRVLIFSDSEVTVRTGNGEYSYATNNPAIWLQFAFYRSIGYEFTFFHQPRNTNPMHVAMDQASKQGDVLAAGIDWLTGIELYDLLPWVPAISSPLSPENTYVSPIPLTPEIK